MPVLSAAPGQAVPVPVLSAARGQVPLFANLSACPRNTLALFPKVQLRCNALCCNAPVRRLQRARSTFATRLLGVCNAPVRRLQRGCSAFATRLLGVRRYNALAVFSMALARRCCWRALGSCRTYDHSSGACTLAHADTHAHHIHTHPCTHAHCHAHEYARTHAHTHTHTRTRTDTDTHAHTRALRHE